MSAFSAEEKKIVGLVYSDIILDLEDPVGLKIKKIVKSSIEDYLIFAREYCTIKSFFAVVVIRGLKDIKDDKVLVNEVIEETLGNVLKYSKISAINSLEKDYIVKRINAYYKTLDNEGNNIFTKEFKNGVDSKVLIRNNISDSTLDDILRETWIYVQDVMFNPNKSRMFQDIASGRAGEIIEQTEKLLGHRAPVKQSKGGCYIATCVYGSYDCPNVWVLRRFRDEVLAENIFGRVFIKIYYAVSPKMVKYLGNYQIIRAFWKNILNKLVEHLKNKGFSSNPYFDK